MIHMRCGYLDQNIDRYPLNGGSMVRVELYEICAHRLNAKCEHVWAPRNIRNTKNAKPI